MIIIAVAIKQKELLYVLPKPKRHTDILFNMIKDLTSEAPICGEQGFLTSDGRFVNRVEAGKIAGFNRSITSEDLW